jgi:hypothetical protein
MAKTPPPALPVASLRQLARERLRDAQALLDARRYDGGVYLCGYAVEIALKARICRTLKWTAFPTSRENYRSFFVHNLDVLLNLSGREAFVKSTLMADWSLVASWDPEVRYASTGVATELELTGMIAAAQNLLRRL